MTYQTLNDFNGTGVEGLFQYTSEIVPIFFPLVLLGFFLVVLMSVYLKSERRDFISAFAVASILTSIVSFLIGMIPGVLPSIVVIICFVISIIAVILLFTNQRE